MKLHTFYVAPNPTKVALYLAEKKAGGAQIDLEIVKVNLTQGEQNSDAAKAKNPFGRLPFLELDGGEILLESLAIIQYLEELYPSPPMIGSDPLERAKVRAIERTIEFGIMMSAGFIVHATNSPAGYPPDPAVAARFQQRLPVSMQYVEGLLEDGRPFIAGQTPTIADCTMAAALQFARFGKCDVGDYPQIAAWDEAYRAREEVSGVFIF